MTDGIENREGKYYDWDKALFRTGIYQDNNLSLSGGTDATKYFSSLGYTTDKSRIRVNDFERISGRLNLTQKIVDNLEFGTNINIGHNKKKGFNDTRNTGSNYFLQSRNLLWPLYWPTNYKTGEDWTDRYGSYAYNADYYDNQWDNSSKTNKLGVISNLTWNILPSLTAKTVFSYDYTDMKDYLYYSAKHFNGVSDGGVVHQFNTNINITILWLIPEAYYIAYDVLIADLFKEIPLPLNINWQFQAKCIYIILSAIFPLIGYTDFKLKRVLSIGK